ncbi:MAG: PolC-type DNA polymerase III [Lachnospiraceae bacterium]
MLENYVVVDVETTGLDSKKNEIIEIGAVKVENGEITDTFQSLIRPVHALDERITQLTGITQSDVCNAPFIENVLPGFITFLGNHILVGHNLWFDYAFLKHVCTNQGYPFEHKGVDTLRIARIYLKDLPKKNLTALCEYYKIPLQAHRAENDAVATCKLLECLKRDFGQQVSGFEPAVIACKFKKEGPITPAQKARLYRMLRYYEIQPDYDVERLTKNEASRIMDQMTAQFGLFPRDV